jgi:multisubunit Na+/H+ antiporter MnhG subunit
MLDIIHGGLILAFVAAIIWSLIRCNRWSVGAVLALYFIILLVP